MLSCVLEVVGRWKHLHTYYLIVIFLGPFGILFLGGLVFLLCCVVMLQVIIFNSALLVVLPSQGGPSYMLFDLQQCGKFGKKETIELSMTNMVLFSRWWTKLSL